MSDVENVAGASVTAAREGHAKASTPQRDGRSRGARILRARPDRWASRSGLLIAWVAEICIFALVEPDSFLRLASFKQLASSQADLVMLSLAVIPTLAVSEIDLSVASVMALTATLYGQLNGVDHLGMAPTLIICLAAAAATGVVSGFITVYLDVRGIIVSLGMGTFVLGITSLVSKSLTVGGISAGLGNVVNHQFGGVSAAFFIALAMAILLWYVLRHTPGGRSMLFLGFNRDVARLSGIPQGRIRFGSFVLGAVIAGLAGIVSIGVAGGADPTSFQPLLLPAFAATFLGTLTFTPGQVNPLGNVVALYFLATGIFGIELLGVGNWINNAFYGGALVAIVALSGVVNKLGASTRTGANQK